VCEHALVGLLWVQVIGTIPFQKRVHILLFAFMHALHRLSTLNLLCFDLSNESMLAWSFPMGTYTLTQLSSQTLSLSFPMGACTQSSRPNPKTPKACALSGPRRAAAGGAAVPAAAPAAGAQGAAAATAAAAAAHSFTPCAQATQSGDEQQR